MSTLGGGAYSYFQDKSWAKMPEGQVLRDLAGVAVDRHDRVFAFCRGARPIMVFDDAGKLLTFWGKGLFRNPHAISMGLDDTIFCTDEGNHCVRKFSLDGELLMTVGTPDRPSPAHSGMPFNRCTHTALSPEGDIYVSDGYGNSRVHKYSPEGRHLFSWGEPGLLPGQFSQPHNIVCDAAGLVYVADREAHRIQVFDGNGTYQCEWGGVHRPSGLFMTQGPCPLCYVTEMAPHRSGNFGWPNLGPRVTILDNAGHVVQRLGKDPLLGTAAGQFLAAHGIAVNSRGDIYVAELAYANWERLFPGTQPPGDICGLQKLVKQPAAKASQ